MVPFFVVGGIVGDTIRAGYDVQFQPHLERHLSADPQHGPAKAESSEITRVLRRFSDGDRAVIPNLVPLVYEELHRLASIQMAGERANHTLQPTALLHEALYRLLQREQPNWENRAQFYRNAGAIMRYLLVNHARDRRRQKRGGDSKRVPLDDAIHWFEEQGLDLLALDEALEKLRGIDARQADLVELRFFAGISAEETATLLGVSVRTIQTDWSLCRAWLKRELGAV